MKISLNKDDVAYLTQLLGYPRDKVLTKQAVIEALPRTHVATVAAVARLFADNITDC